MGRVLFRTVPTPLFPANSQFSSVRAGLMLPVTKLRCLSSETSVKGRRFFLFPSEKDSLAEICLQAMVPSRRRKSNMPSQVRNMLDLHSQIHDRTNSVCLQVFSNSSMEPLLICSGCDRELLVIIRIETVCR